MVTIPQLQNLISGMVTPEFVNARACAKERGGCGILVSNQEINISYHCLFVQ